MLGEHGVGMIHLAQRSERGANLKDMQYRFGGMLANVRAKRVGIEKRGDSIAIFVSLEGEPMQQLGPPITLHFDAPFYVGIGFCSHLPDKSDSAVLSNVLLENSAGKCANALRQSPDDPRQRDARALHLLSSWRSANAWAPTATASLVPRRLISTAVRRIGSYRIRRPLPGTSILRNFATQESFALLRVVDPEGERRQAAQPGGVPLVRRIHRAHRMGKKKRVRQQCRLRSRPGHRFKTKACASTSPATTPSRRNASMAATRLPGAAPAAISAIVGGSGALSCGILMPLRRRAARLESRRLPRHSRLDPAGCAIAMPLRRRSYRRGTTLHRARSHRPTLCPE